MPPMLQQRWQNTQGWEVRMVGAAQRGGTRTKIAALSSGGFLLSANISEHAVSERPSEGNPRPGGWTVTVGNTVLFV